MKINKVIDKVDTLSSHINGWLADGWIVTYKDSIIESCSNNNTVLTIIFKYENNIGVESFNRKKDFKEFINKLELYVNENDSGKCMDLLIDEIGVSYDK